MHVMLVYEQRFHYIITVINAIIIIKIVNKKWS